MKARIAAAVATLALGIAPLSAALAYGGSEPYARTAPYAAEWTGTPGVHDGPLHDRCPMSSAAEGNANQQNFPVKQYGQTTGGNRC